jgi:class 3 adenylate cyclase
MTTSDLDPRLDVLRTSDTLRAAVLDDFKAFLTHATDEALFRMSPLRYAAEHGLGEQEAIELFLHATHVGILEFAWGVLCPGCMAFLTTPGGLRSLHTRKHCTLCHIAIEGTIDDRVEVAFTVAPSVRRIRFHALETLDMHEDALRVYFSRSLDPNSLPHQALARGIVHAGRAEPRAAHEARLSLPEGHFVLLVPASHMATYIHTRPGGPTSVSLDLLDDRTLPGELDVAAGEVSLRILNRTAHVLGYTVTPISYEGWPKIAPPGAPLTHPVTPYLSGARLVSSQTFRDLFRAESIPSEGGLELKSVTVLFTDLTGSTALYERVGDLRAYDLVRKHFTLLRAIVTAEGGAIVKTIGDAVMASFADPSSAMRAAVLMNRAVAELGEGDMMLKIGLHTGACIAVELNERLDYFGRTVNIAARVQGIAAAGQIVCTEPVYGAPGVGQIVAAAGLRAERASAPLKGIAGEVAVVRLSRGGGTEERVAAQV